MHAFAEDRETVVCSSRSLRRHYRKLVKVANRGGRVLIAERDKSALVLIGLEEFRRYEEYLQSPDSKPPAK